MKHRIVTITIVTVTLAFCLVFAARAPSRAAASGFETLTFQGVQTILAESRGKVVVINFFATWCPPCREEVPGLVNIRKTFGEDKLLLIGASLDEDEKALAGFVKKTKINYPVKKAGQDLAAAAGVRGIPHMLIFDPKGEVAANEAGLVPENALRNFLQGIMEPK